ncbi:hypothetical protein C8R46DRAFT_1045405 [Mycena filopes]|nr:hypothetical protein C8R46DRAFT_1045405 [Mycena filopes]
MVIALPHNVVAPPDEAYVRHPHRETWHEAGHRYELRWHGCIVLLAAFPPPSAPLRLRALVRAETDARQADAGCAELVMGNDADGARHADIKLIEEAENLTYVEKPLGCLSPFFL